MKAPTKTKKKTRTPNVKFDPRVMNEMIRTLARQDVVQASRVGFDLILPGALRPALDKEEHLELPFFQVQVCQGDALPVLDEDKMDKSFSAYFDKAGRFVGLVAFDRSY